MGAFGSMAGRSGGSRRTTAAPTLTPTPTQTPAPAPVRERPEQDFYDTFPGLSRPNIEGREQTPVQEPEIPEQEVQPEPQQPAAEGASREEQMENIRQQIENIRQEITNRQIEEKKRLLREQIENIRRQIELRMEEYRQQEKERRDKENQDQYNPYGTDGFGMIGPGAEDEEGTTKTPDEAVKDINNIFDDEKVNNYKSKAAIELSDAADKLMPGIENSFIGDTIEKIIDLESEIDELSEEKKKIRSKIANIGEGQITTGVLNRMLRQEIMEYDDKISDIEERKERYIRTAELYGQYVGQASRDSASMVQLIDDQYRRLNFNERTGETSFIRNTQTGEIVRAPRPASILNREAAQEDRSTAGDKVIEATLAGNLPFLVVRLTRTQSTRPLRELIGGLEVTNDEGRRVPIKDYIHDLTDSGFHDFSANEEEIEHVLSDIAQNIKQGSATPAQVEIWSKIMQRLQITQL